jgi:hypothetical protein
MKHLKTAVDKNNYHGHLRGYMALHKDDNRGYVIEKFNFERKVFMYNFGCILLRY